MPIREYIKEGDAFEPNDITAMSMAFENVCKALGVQDQISREVVATRILELARDGERSPTKLRDRVLREATLAEQFVKNE